MLVHEKGKDDTYFGIGPSGAGPGQGRTAPGIDRRRTASVEVEMGSMQGAEDPGFHDEVELICGLNSVAVEKVWGALRQRIC